MNYKKGVLFLVVAAFSVSYAADEAQPGWLQAYMPSAITSGWNAAKAGAQRIYNYLPNSNVVENVLGGTTAHAGLGALLGYGLGYGFGNNFNLDPYYMARIGAGLGGMGFGLRGSIIGYHLGKIKTSLGIQRSLLRTILTMAWMKSQGKDPLNENNIGQLKDLFKEFIENSDINVQDDSILLTLLLLDGNEQDKKDAIKRICDIVENTFTEMLKANPHLEWSELGKDVRIKLVSLADGRLEALTKK